MLLSLPSGRKDFHPHKYRGNHTVTIERISDLALTLAFHLLAAFAFRLCFLFHGEAPYEFRCLACATEPAGDDFSMASSAAEAATRQEL